MNPLPQTHEHHFYPEGHVEQFFMNFNTAPSKPNLAEDEVDGINEAQEKEHPFKRKSWTKTTDAWA